MPQAHHHDFLIQMRDFRDFCFVPAADPASDEKFASLLKDTSLVGIGVYWEGIEDILLNFSLQLLLMLGRCQYKRRLR